MLLFRELDQMLIVPEDENIEQTDLCVKEKDTTICCISGQNYANPDIEGFCSGIFFHIILKVFEIA